MTLNKNFNYSLNYKNFNFLKKFLSSNYRITFSKIINLSKSSKKKINKYIKYLKYLAVMPYIYKFKFK